MHSVRLVHGVHRAVRVSTGLANPSQRDQPAAWLEEPDQFSTNLNAFGHMFQGVLKMILLVEHLRDSQVRLGSMERRHPVTIGGVAQAVSVGA